MKVMKVTEVMKARMRHAQHAAVNCARQFFTPAYITSITYITYIT
jgi:hypothetical protein